MKHESEFSRFTRIVDSILSVPREGIMRREAEYRAQVDANPKRRGPKRGSKRQSKQPSASPGPAAEPHP